MTEIRIGGKSAPKPLKNSNGKPKQPFKWVAIGLGVVFGLSHIGMIGMLSRRNNLPVLNLPVGPYTSYSVEASKDGYIVDYRSNDPKVMEVTKDINRPGGFLGLGKTKVKTTEHYTMGGAQHLGSKEGLSQEQIACIKAEGSGEGTGKMVGGSIGAAASPTLSGIPFVGWVLAGAATMIGMDQGGEIGGQMAKDFADC